MPELPDVETLKRYLDATSLYQTIDGVDVSRSDALQGVSRRRLSRTLHGQQFCSSRRYGKYLAVKLEDGEDLVMHFGMTGFLKYFEHDEQEPAHSRVVFSFENGYHLAYDSQRLIGALRLVSDFDRFTRNKGLGPDAWALDREAFEARIAGRRGMIKSALMNQGVIAGLGNVYTDEILFQARVHPKASVADLSERDLERLFKAMRKVLEKAVDVQANPERVPPSWLLPRRKPGASCPSCGGQVEKIKVSGRGGYYCPHCQSG